MESTEKRKKRLAFYRAAKKHIYVNTKRPHILTLSGPDPRHEHKDIRDVFSTYDVTSVDRDFDHTKKKVDRVTFIHGSLKDPKVSELIKEVDIAHLDFCKSVKTHFDDICGAVTKLKDNSALAICVSARDLATLRHVELSDKNEVWRQTHWWVKNEGAFATDSKGKLDTWVGYLAAQAVDIGRAYSNNRPMKLHRYCNYYSDVKNMSMRFLQFY